MTHTYSLTGMTCAHCKVTVEGLLLRVDGVTKVNVDQPKGEAEITMSQHVATTALQQALAGTKYTIAEKPAVVIPIVEEDRRTWLETYKPVLLILAFITGISFLVEMDANEFSWMRWMRYFMAGFFLTFSFFKLLNLSGFADSYSTYDIVAKRWRGYAFLYAFIELGLGVAYLLDFASLLTNAVTSVVMSVSLVGVLQSVLNKRKIRCACLGDVFNLPMSTVTIIEDALMIGMALFMIVIHTL